MMKKIVKVQIDIIDGKSAMIYNEDKSILTVLHDPQQVQELAEQVGDEHKAFFNYKEVNNGKGFVITSKAKWQNW